MEKNKAVLDILGAMKGGTNDPPAPNPSKVISNEERDRRKAKKKSADKAKKRNR